MSSNPLWFTLNSINWWVCSEIADSTSNQEGRSPSGSRSVNQKCFPVSVLASWDFDITVAFNLYSPGSRGYMLLSLIFQKSKTHWNIYINILSGILVLYYSGENCQLPSLTTFFTVPHGVLKLMQIHYAYFKVYIKYYLFTLALH